MATTTNIKQSEVRVQRQPVPANAGHLCIERGNYIALKARDPAAAASFAVDHLGFYLAHVDSAGRHYLAAHGLDPYSLVYVPGDELIDHMSFAVKNLAALDRAASALGDIGVQFERLTESPMWRHQPAIQFSTPTGVTIELTPGISIDLPMSELLPSPSAPVAPLTFDHAILRAERVGELRQFATDVLGLRESGSIVTPDGSPVLSFFRCHTLYHCFGTAASSYDGIHHYQFSLKNDRAVFSAYEKLVNDPEVEIVWGPVKHGAGQSVSLYIRDFLGNIVEFSAEEELVLDDEAWEVLYWPVTNERAADEWGTHPPSAITEGD